MKVVLVSNYFNHHQRPFCDAMDQKCESFRFIATSVMREDRKKLGYAFEEPDYVIRAYERGGLDAAKREIAAADVVIYGMAFGELSKPKYYRGKTVFYYSERLYKQGCKRWLLPYRAIRFYFSRQWRQRSVLLCASAFAARDYSRTLTLCGKYYKWGYFPETKQYDTDRLIPDKEENKLLWCGRLIDWKHPELAVLTAAGLRDAGYDFSMDIIGSGDMENALRELITERRLEDKVRLLGSMPPEKIREHMEKAQVYLLTSDQQEGWGAVLNEAMNSGCAVVASSAAGSVPFLLSDGVNGCLFQSGDAEMLFDKTRALLDSRGLSEKYGKAAYETITSLWNADTAAQRFLNCADRLCRDAAFEEYPDGPLSRAELLGDKWFESDT